MRIHISIALIALLALGAGYLGGSAASLRTAVAEDPADPWAHLLRDLTELKRDHAAVRSYVLANAARAAKLDALVVELRRLGFAAAANPSAARERLLTGLTDLAKSLREGLPER